MNQQTKKDAQGDTIGEGNYDATRRYRQGLEESVREGKAEELAKKALQDIEGEDAESYREAEEKAKHGETPSK